jgi:hypothetical protein
LRSVEVTATAVTPPALICSPEVKSPVIDSEMWLPSTANRPEFGAGTCTSSMPALRLNCSTISWPKVSERSSAISRPN